MPEPTNAARELAATGTQGPWSAHEGDLEGKTPLDYIATLLRNREQDGTTTGRLFLMLAPNDIDPECGAEVVPATTGDGPRSEANAVKIARAVNALGPWADYDDAVLAYMRHQTVCTDGPECRALMELWDDFCFKRDAVEAALRGEQP